LKAELSKINTLDILFVIQIDLMLTMRPEHFVNPGQVTCT